MSTWFPPSECRQANPQHEFLKPGTKLRRIYAREPYDYRADSFRHYGPQYRFDHHQSRKGQPGDDPERGILYVSESTPCCFLEVFYPDGVVSRYNREGGEHRLAKLEVTHPLMLLKLHGEDAAIDAGTTGNIATAPHDETQPWARHFYENPQTYLEIDGISYHASQGGQVSIALFERAQGKLMVVEDHPFSEPNTRSNIIQLAFRYHLEVEGL